jgi:flagellar protein FlaI
VLEFAEMNKKGDANVVYRWDLKSDKMRAIQKMTSLVDTLSLYSGMTDKEIEADMEEKMGVLDWMVKKGYDDVDQVGHIVSNYYINMDEIVDTVKKGKNWDFNSQVGV